MTWTKSVKSASVVVIIKMVDEMVPKVYSYVGIR